MSETRADGMTRRKDHPFFTIIMPSHNGAGRIRKAIESVTSQAFSDYELIVVCDACTDNTADIARFYGATVLTVDAHRDGLARNAGLDAATGDWILFLDDDDWLLHEFVLRQLREALNGRSTDVLNFSFIWKGVGYHRQTLEDTYTGACGHLWRREFIGDTRFPDLPYGSDSLFHQAMMWKRPAVCYWDMPMYYYNYMRQGSLSWKKQRGEAMT